MAVCPRAGCGGKVMQQRPIYGKPYPICQRCGHEPNARVAAPPLPLGAPIGQQRNPTFARKYGP